MTQRPETGRVVALLVAAGVAAACSTSADGPTGAPASGPHEVEEQTPFTPAPPSVAETVSVGPASPSSGVRAMAGPTIDDTAADRTVSFSEGEALFARRRYEEAARIFFDHTGRHPDDPWGHYMLGLSRWKTGAGLEAEVAFMTALAIDPVHVKSLVSLARVLIADGRVGEALERLQVARDYDPTSADVFRLLGRVHHARDEVDQAIDAYHHAILLDNEDAWSMNNLGLLLLELGRAAEAVPPLARAVELREDVPVFHNNLGMALEHNGRFVAAAEAYDLALGVDPTHEKALVNYGRVEPIEPDSMLEPFDRSAVAARFADSLRSDDDVSVVATVEEEEGEE